MGIATAFEGSGFGRVVLTATDATQYAWEGDKVIGDTQKSVFTHFLIEGLKGDADRDGDGRIHVDELYDYAYEQVVRRTPKQTPGKWSYKQQGDIVLRENLKPRDVRPAPLPSELLELLSHPNSGVRRAGLQDLISLLDGKHLGLARTAQEKLREIADNDDSLTLRKTASETLIAHGITLEPSIETPKASLYALKPAPVETPKEERRKEKLIEKSTALPGKSPSSQEFSSLLVKIPNIPRKLFERKVVVPKLNKRLLGRNLGLLLMIVFLGWAGKAIINNWRSFNSPAMSTSNPNAITTSQPTATRTSQPTRTNTPWPTETSIPATPTSLVFAEPTPILAIIQASEGGGGFVRERPGGAVLATLGNGSVVTIVPNGLQEVNGVIWVHVFTTVNSVRVEGWMIQIIVHTATPT